MAENEYLDSSKARRWLSVAEAIRDVCDMNELQNRVQDRWYKTLNTICKEIPFAELVACVDDPPELARRCNEIEGGADVIDLLQEAASGKVGREDILAKFLTDALQRCLYDVPWLAAKLDTDVNISDARRRLQTVQIGLAHDIHRIATKLNENPSWKPRRLKTPTTADSPIDTTRKMLTESLIAGFRK